MQDHHSTGIPERVREYRRDMSRYNSSEVRLRENYGGHDDQEGGKRQKAKAPMIKATNFDVKDTDIDSNLGRLSRYVGPC
jgi:hypothetical protein